MLNRGYAYISIVSGKSRGQTLLSHLASLYPHSTPQAWQQNLDNGEVTVNGVTATGSESLTLGQTLIWNRPPWIEPDAPQHFEVLFDDSHLLAVNKPGGLPTLPGGVFMEKGATVTAAGGPISITGRNNSTGTGNTNMSVIWADSATSIRNDGSGGVTITGFGGGSGASSFDYVVACASTVVL